MYDPTNFPMWKRWKARAPPPPSPPPPFFFSFFFGVGFFTIERQIAQMIIVDQGNQKNTGNGYLLPCYWLSVKPGLGHWQTVQTQIRRRWTQRLIRVCTVCFNYRKLRIKLNSLAFPFRTIFPAYTRTIYPVSILHKSIVGRSRPVRVADGPRTARCRFVKNASWVPTSAVSALIIYLPWDPLFIYSM